MPIPAFMTLEGATQEDISAGGCSEDSLGTLSREDHEDQIQIQEFRHSIQVPTDPQSGQPVSSRIHEELKIVKMQDQTSPLLFQALNTGETISEAEIEWYRINAAGEEEHYFTTTIENARITRIRSYMPDVIAPLKESQYSAENPYSNNETTVATPRTHMEEVTFRYRKIGWVHEIAGTEGEDDWDGEE